MKVLVVGGTGLIGGEIALLLRARGHEVTIGARKPAPPRTLMAELPFLQGNYVTGGFGNDQLKVFDSLVFAAGQDFRHVPSDTDMATHWHRANIEGVPKFFAQARDAGLKRAVNIGSFYPQAMPELIKTDDYVRSRFLADEGARALASDSFMMCSLNAPFILGCMAGLELPHLENQANYAMWRIEGALAFAIPGGVNFMSARALAEATLGALERGQGGKAYLVGDENLSFHAYFMAFFRAAGRTEVLEVIDQEHPILPDAVLYAGRGGEIFYDPEPVDVERLDYTRGDVERAIREIVQHYR